MLPFTKTLFLKKKRSKLFRNLNNKGEIPEKELKYFTTDFKKATNLGKLHLLPKIHKRLSEVPSRSVISNCGTPTEKVSEFLDCELIGYARRLVVHKGLW